MLHYLLYYQTPTESPKAPTLPLLYYTTYFTTCKQTPFVSPKGQRPHVILHLRFFVVLLRAFIEIKVSASRRWEKKKFVAVQAHVPELILHVLKNKVCIRSAHANHAHVCVCVCVCVCECVCECVCVSVCVCVCVSGQLIASMHTVLRNF